ncbi:MAG: cupin domain-containing protein [Hyphomicrobiales bacterium]
MNIRSDFSKYAIVRPGDETFVPSPLAGVDRMMLDRVGDEVARATTIVRYAPGSEFSAHTHDMGEEFIVLDGVFSDESGDFPEGSYVRNPPGSSHTPRSEKGCTIFVKLRQFDDADLERVIADVNAEESWQPAPTNLGAEIRPLHKFSDEFVRLVRFRPGGELGHHDHPLGEELLVLQGELRDENGVYPRGTWMRSPPGSAHAPFSKEGALVWVKSGHLGDLV